MKKLLLITIACLGAQLTYAQFPNLGKVKDQATSTVKNVGKKKGKKAKDEATSTSNNDASTSSSTTTSTSDKKTDGRPEYDPNDPTYLAYSRVRDNINYTKSALKPETWGRNIERNNEDAVKYLDKASTNLEILREAGEADKGYFAPFEQDIKDLEVERAAKFEDYTLNQQYDAKLESYYKFVAYGWEMQDSTLEPSYKGYYAFRDEFETNRPEYFQASYVQKRVETINTYFEVDVYEVIPHIAEDVDDIIAEMYELNSRDEPYYYLNAPHSLKDFDKPIKRIKYNKEYLIENTEELDAIQAKIDKEVAILNEYINSGKHEAHVAEYHQEIIDAVRLRKPMMSNSSYTSMVKNGVDNGTVNRVVIASSDWWVEKNDFGYPLYKYLPVDIAVTDENGKCWLAYGQIRKSYEGGGSYGNAYFNYWGKQEEMNCKNINE